MTSSERRRLLKCYFEQPPLTFPQKTLSKQYPKVLFAQCMNWLPSLDTHQTNDRVISEEVPYYYVWRNKRHTLILGQKPNSLPKNKVVNQQEMRHHMYIESYVNTISRAMEYKRMLKEEALSQSQLAQKISVSRVRITQYLNLLKLPENQQDHILQYGKEKMITERTLRNEVPSIQSPDLPHLVVPTFVRERLLI